MKHLLKPFEHWTRRTESFVLEVMMGERRGVVAGFVRVLLRISSKLFSVAVRVRRVWEK
jgi:hypothetical protein